MYRCWRTQRKSRYVFGFPHRGRQVWTGPPPVSGLQETPTSDVTLRAPAIGPGSILMCYMRAFMSRYVFLSAPPSLTHGTVAVQSSNVIRHSSIRRECVHETTRNERNHFFFSQGSVLSRGSERPHTGMSKQNDNELICRTIAQGYIFSDLCSIK